ncbi:MAG TPA: MBL fold metallo-hydrolase [Phycisphaerales bacterium]|nr:MBL fold metallo-hydrolase [Phycisphaerales bacterium]
MDAATEQVEQRDGGQGRAAAMRLCVLGSGSRANCTAVHTVGPDGRVSLCLIDLGFSPRMTDRLLRQVGLSLDMVTAVLLTHLDSDHCHAGWCFSGAGAGTTEQPCRLPRDAAVFLHEGHLQRAYSRGLNGGRLQKFGGERGRRGPVFVACERAGSPISVQPLMTFHDDLGAAVFRVQLGGEDAPAFGYATDLGRVTDELIDHLRDDRARGLDGVDALVIESNYCPRMQVASDRPEFLKRRVMGGRGHLSNQEALEAVEAIAPREHVVLVHLSQQCNNPALVASMHVGAGYTLTVSSQDEPTRWVPVRRLARTEIVTRPRRRGAQLSLWG